MHTPRIFVSFLVVFICYISASHCIDCGNKCKNGANKRLSIKDIWLQFKYVHLRTSKYVNNYDKFIGFLTNHLHIEAKDRFPDEEFRAKK
jgi:hypothetical protein